MMIAIMSIVFAGPVITLIGGVKYAHSDAVILFRIFMTMAIMYPADRFFALTLDVINKPQINFYKILIMLAINLLGDYLAIQLFHSVYAIVLVNIFPILVAIIISYTYLNRYHKFNFWSIYIVGYKEALLFIRQIMFKINHPSL